MLLDDLAEHGWDSNWKIKWSEKWFPDDLSELLISYEKTDCDNDVDNDFEVNFDHDDDDYITDDEKEFNDENWKTQFNRCVAKFRMTTIIFVYFFVPCWKTKHRGLWDVIYYVEHHIKLLYKCILCVNIGVRTIAPEENCPSVRVRV